MFRILMALSLMAVGLLAWLPAVAQSPSPAPVEARSVLVMTVAGPINPVVASYVDRGLRAAADQGAEAAVIRLDTPGGLDSAMRDIIQDMVASRVPVVVYVAPQGARAASAGMFITVAAHVAAMAPDTAIGAAHPVGGGGEEIEGPMGDKVTNDAVAYARGLAAQRGRNVKWVEDAIRKSISAPATEALELKVVDVVAPSLEALLDDIDGRKVMVLGNETTLATENASVVDMPMNAVEGFLYAISNPALALILMNLGILGIIFELQNPGGFVAGVTGVILLLLGLFALGMVPINGIGLALIFLGLVLFAAELFVPSFGILAIGGVVALVLGGLMLFQTDVPGLSPSIPLILTISLSTGLLIIVAIYFALRARRRPIAAGREELVGRRAEVRAALAPEGMVFLEGELWRAEATEGAPVAVGDHVTVQRVEGLKLFVTKKQEEKGK